MKQIKCEECGEKYTPKKGFDNRFAFAWCPKCLKDYEDETSRRFQMAIGKHLKSEFNSDYERDKFALNLYK